MKKILVSAMALLMLCACGGGSKDGSQSVCTGTLEGMDTTVTLDFDAEEKLTNMELKMSVDAGSAEVAEATKTMMESQKDTLLAQFGGAGDIKVDVNGTVVEIAIIVDVEKASSSNLDIDFDTTKEEIIKSIEADGFTCK